MERVKHPRPRDLNLKLRKDDELVFLDRKSGLRFGGGGKKPAASQHAPYNKRYRISERKNGKINETLPFPQKKQKSSTAINNNNNRGGGESRPF